MRTVFAIWRKDLIDALVNLRLLAFIAVPVIMSVLFGSLFGELRGSDIPVGLTGAPGPAVVVPVYDAGESQIVHILHASELYEVRSVDSAQEIERMLLRDHLGAGLVLPEGFDAALMEGGQPTIQLLVNAQQPDSSTALRAWLTHALWDRTGQPFPSTTRVETLAPQNSRPLDQRQENMALWLVMSLVTNGLYVVPALLIEEKEAHTLKIMLTTPVSYEVLILAKAGVGLFYSLLTSILILILNRGLAANAGMVIAAIFFGALVMVEMGLLMGSLFNNMTALNTWSTPIMLVLMLPGMVYSLLASGLFRLGVLEHIVQLLPTHYILRAVYAALSDQVVAESIGIDLGLLGGAAIITFSLIIVALRRRER